MNMLNRPQAHLPVSHNGEVEKLIEYRRAHYVAHSEASTYFTNTPARVQFRFSNPILCFLTAGRKVMQIDGKDPFDFAPGEIVYVPPGQEIDVDLTTATPDTPITCDCLEIENGLMESILAKLNGNLSRNGDGTSLAMDWSSSLVLRGSDARSLDFQNIMDVFRGERDVFTEMRIDARIDDMILRILQIGNRTLLTRRSESQDSGILAIARHIREHLEHSISIQELARLARVSESTLHRQFQRQFGTTPSRFAHQMRVAEARRRLRDTDESIEFIAFSLGFSDASHLSRAFRNAMGEPPSDYRKRRRTPPILKPCESGSTA